MEFSALVGETLSSVDGGKHDDQITFTTTSGEVFHLSHDPICCESVSVDDIEGEVADLIGSPIVLAEVVSSYEPRAGQDTSRCESFTWTFYRLATAKGFAVIRWYGESNGNYSEIAKFYRVTK